MIRKRNFVAALAAALLLPAAATAAEITISGSTSVAAQLVQPHEAQIEAAAGVSLNIIANGSGRGLQDLAEGKAAVAMISAPLEVTAESVNKKQPGAVDAAGMVAHQVGEARVAFVVHPANPVKQMTQEQVAGILSGAIANWSALGGPDLPIVVVTEVAGGGLRSMVESEMLGKAPITGNLRELPNATQVAQVVQQISPGFGVAAHASVAGSGASVVATEREIAQPLILVTRGTPSAEIARVIDAARVAGS